jgi:protein-tyrosine-phosphatase
MAEAIARSLGGCRVKASSAGLAPLGWISDQTLHVLRTLGHDTEGLSSKGLDEVGWENLDIVVSLLGPRGLDAVPQSIGARREAWAIVDPFGEDEELYLAVARELEDRIRQLLTEEDGVELFRP